MAFHSSAIAQSKARHRISVHPVRVTTSVPMSDEGNPNASSTLSPRDRYSIQNAITSKSYSEGIAASCDFSSGTSCTVEYIGDAGDAATLLVPTKPPLSPSLYVCHVWNTSVRRLPMR